MADHERNTNKRLRQVLQCMSGLGMTLKCENCMFAQSSVKFLGHVSSRSRIRPDPDKVSAIVQAPAPTNVSDVRHFLGIVNQLSKFSPNVAHPNHEGTPGEGENVGVGRPPAECLHQSRGGSHDQSGPHTIRPQPEDHHLH